MTARKLRVVTPILGLLLVFVVVIFVTITPQSNAAEGKKLISVGDFDRMAEILFPEARAWRRIDKLPVVTAAEMDSQLVDRMFAKKSGVTGEEDFVCSFRDRLKRDLGHEGNLHRGDVFGPGDDDLVYGGSEPCSEGNISIIWRHVHDPEKMSAFRWSRIIRLEASTSPHAVDVEIGCCATAYNIFHISALLGGPARSVYVLNNLEIPEDADEASGRVLFKQRTLLRWWPREATVNPNEDFDLGGFNVNGQAYPSGTEGELLMSYHDVSGKLWQLVRVPLSSTSTAGWVSH